MLNCYWEWWWQTLIESLDVSANSSLFKPISMQFDFITFYYIYPFAFIFCNCVEFFFYTYFVFFCPQFHLWWWYRINWLVPQRERISLLNAVRRLFQSQLTSGCVRARKMTQSLLPVSSKHSFSLLCNRIWPYSTALSIQFNRMDEFQTQIRIRVSIVN